MRLICFVIVIMYSNQALSLEAESSSIINEYTKLLGQLSNPSSFETYVYAYVLRLKDFLENNKSDLSLQNEMLHIAEKLTNAVIKRRNDNSKILWYLRGG